MIEGKTIAITRAEDDSQEFIDLITKGKGNALPLPTIELVSKGEKIVDEFLSALAKEDPDYSVFMSSKAVILLFETAKKAGKFEELRLAVANTILLLGFQFFLKDPSGKVLMHHFVEQSLSFQPHLIL